MKVAILAAGRGSRMNRYGKWLHKGLLPVNNQAVISHIVNQFPKNTEFVIALGYRADQVRDYFSIAHPGLKVEFAEVKNFDGPGSGPGLSLLACKPYLPGSFVFTACDGLFELNGIAYDDNWVGTQKVSDIEQWCSIETMGAEHGARVKLIKYKTKAATDLAFIGIAHVRNHEIFWRGLESQNHLEAGELQVNNGLTALIEYGLKAIAIPWRDAGTDTNYERCVRAEAGNFTFLGKDTDQTYRIENQIIKFFPKEEVARNRYQRALANPKAFAKVIELRGNLFSYEFVPGELLANDLTYEKIYDFLTWAQTQFWRELKIDQDQFTHSLREFYFDKTASRIRDYLANHEATASIAVNRINGRECPDAMSLLEQIPEEFYSQGLPSTYHGDLHTDNIIVTTDGYRLIDWRDSFGKLIEIGDRYYDLAKFHHTLVLSVDVMNRGAYSIGNQNGIITISHENSFREQEAMAAFLQFIEEQGYSRRRVEILSALVFLNMAPLYARAMSDYLYNLGRYQLSRLVG